MKIVGLVVMLFGLLTAIYGTAVVVPKYRDVESAWMLSSPSYGAGVTPSRAAVDRHERLGDKRDVVRSRAQSYAMTAIGCASLSIVLALVTRKKPGIAAKWVIGGGVATLALFGVMQGWGNIF